MAGGGSRAGTVSCVPLPACLRLWLWISRASDEVQMGRGGGAGAAWGLAWGEKSRLTLPKERGVERIGKFFRNPCISASFLPRGSTFSKNVNNCIKKCTTSLLSIIEPT